MNFDLVKKYLKNKDVKIDEKDFDFDGMANEVYKGYVKEDEAHKGYVKESDYSKLKGDHEALTTKYSTMETNFNNLNSTLTDTNNKLAKTSLEKVMISKGFKEDSFDEISKLRSSLYADEKDDVKAISSIADKYKATYFPETANKVVAPNEGGLQGNASGNGAGGNHDIKITRDTPLRNMTVAK